MKINEITDKNLIWKELNQFDYESLFTSAEVIQKSWPVILGAKSPTRIQYHKDNIQLYLIQAQIAVDQLDLYPDVTDPDIINIKNKLIEIINVIGVLIQ